MSDYFLKKRAKKMIEKISDVMKKGTLQTVKINSIKVPEYHDRTDVDNDNIESLASNMSEVGQLTPIIVEKKDDENFELISGLRRYFAASKLIWTEIDAIVLENLDEQSRILIMIAENAQRENLNDYDLVVSLVHFLAVTSNKNDEDLKAFLYKLKNLDDGKVKNLNLEEKKLKKSLEETMGRTDKYSLKGLISKLKVLNFHPELIQAMKTKKILFSYASMLNKIKDENKMREILTLFVSNQIDKAELKRTVRGILNENKVVFPFDNFIKTLKGDFNNFADEKKKVIQDKITELEKILSA